MKEASMKSLSFTVQLCFVLHNYVGAKKHHSEGQIWTSLLDPFCTEIVAAYFVHEEI